ncbi:ankyrin repeat-containing domain protein [Annulohypoxylon moriforme]|nr:ankyrin repeat-containing domain protein [Annulohypoxylon moriforme]
MADTSDAYSETPSADTSSPKSLDENLVTDSQGGDHSKGSSEPVADISEHDSRDSNNHSHNLRDTPLTKSKDGDDEMMKPWDDLEGYMTGGEMTEYNAEGLVTLWNAQHTTDPKPRKYMAAGFDIIIVHGLRGARRPPWENPGAGTSKWLYDQGLYGDRRVMSFGYNISNILCGKCTHQAIINAATSLLGNLMRARNESNKKNPIMFIAHDIGGVIVKCALTLAGLNPRSYGDIFHFTRILLFYGCPHRVTNIMEMEDKLLKFLYGHNTGPDLPLLANSMRYLAMAIISINALFVDSKHMFHSYILSIYSDNETSCIDKIFDEFTGTLGLPFEIRLSGGLEDDRDRIEKALDWICPLISVDHGQLVNERFLLSITSPPRLPKTVIGSANPYPWLVENEVYQSWYTQQKHLLYLNGKSSTQMASDYTFYNLGEFFVDDEYQIVLSFTFERHDTRRHKIGDMITTFVAQLYGHFQSWIPSGSFDGYRIRHLWNQMDPPTFFSLLHNTDSRIRIYCIINSFDECEDSSRKAFLDSLHCLPNVVKRRFRIVVTSSKLGALLQELSDWPVLEIDKFSPVTDDEGNANSVEAHFQRIRPEVRAYGARYEEELKTIASLEPEVREIILNHVGRNENWPSQNSIETILGPTGGMSLESVVDKIVDNIPDKDFALHTLSWILYAVRPLTSWEFATAIMIGLGESSFIETLSATQSTNQPLDKLQSWLSGIISFEHNEIAISTSRIREILMMKILSRGAHAIIARTCLAYLNIPTMEENLGKLYDESCYMDPRVVIIHDRTTLQNYAVQFWMHHVSLTSIDHDLDNAIRLFSNSKIVPHWAKAYWAFASPATRSRQPYKSLYPYLVGVGLVDQAESWCNEDKNLSEGLIEACFSGALQTIRQLLPRQKHSEECLINALAGASMHGNDTNIFELIEYITKNYTNFPWETQKAVVARVSWLGLNNVLVKLLEVGCLVDAEIPGISTTLTSLGSAVFANNIEGAKILLERGADPTRPDKDGVTYLHEAAFHGSPEMINLLARYGADVNVKDFRRFTPLYPASQQGHTKAVEALVELNANTNLGTTENQNEPCWSPLVASIMKDHLECVRVLLKANADPEISTVSYGTPFGCAVFAGSLEICELLLENGVDPNHESIIPSILYLAMRSQRNKPYLDIVKLIVERGAKLDAQSEEGYSALHFACWWNNPQKLPLVEYLLERGADVNCRSHAGISPLQIAVWENDVGLLQMLLNQNGVDLETYTVAKSTPLNTAVKNKEMVKMLLIHGADPNKYPNGGDSALLRAVQGNHVEVVKVLIQYGARIDVPDELRDDTRWEPVERAVFYGQGDIIRILVEGGADIDRRFTDGSTLIHKGLNSTGLGALLEFRPNLDVKGDDGNTPLHKVTEETPLENVKLLVRAGSDINLKGSFNLTPIIHALRYGREDIARYYLSRKANVNIISPWHGSSLHLACSKGLVDLAEALIDAGADVNAVADEFAGTPLSSIFVHYDVIDSSSETKLELINLLLDKKADPTIMGGFLGSVIGAAAMGGEAVHLQILASKGASLVSCDSIGRQPLHLAALCRHKESVSFILNADSSKLAGKDNTERSVISWAAQGGGIDVLHNLLELAGHDSVNEPDIDGWTPLCWAARGVGNFTQDAGGNQYETIKTLLNYGADRAVKSRINGREYTPTKIARYHGCSSDIIELLTLDNEEDPQPNSYNNKQGCGHSPTSTSRKIFKQPDFWCNSCLFDCYGLRYQCKLCGDFDLCYKCYNSKDKIHPPDHKFEEIGPEFVVVDDSASHSRSPSADSSRDETVTSSDDDSDYGSDDKAEAPQTSEG